MEYKKYGMTVIELLISIVLAVGLLGVIFIIFRNTTNLNKSEALESEFKQKSIVIVQDMTSNISDGYQVSSQLYGPAISGYIDLSPKLSQRLYDTASTYDTFSFYSGRSSVDAGGNLKLVYITYSLRKLQGAPNSFNVYALYKDIYGGINNSDPNTYALESSSKMIGNYTNNENYIGVTKFSFAMRGKELVDIKMQMAGTTSRLGAVTSIRLYRPSEIDFYNTTARLNINQGK